MKAPSDRVLDSVELALERAKEAKDWDRVVRLELKRDRVQAKQFRALQKRIKGMKK